MTQSQRQYRIGLVSNRNSGHNRQQLAAIDAQVKQCEEVIHLITDSPADIDGALRTLAAAGVETLAINGGDGTVSAMLGHILDNPIFSRRPQVVLLPGGTANMNAGDIGVSGKLARAVTRFCRWAQQPNTTAPIRRHLMRVQLAPGEPTHYGMFLGLGAVIQGTEYAHEEIHSRGLTDDISVALGVARTAWGVFRQDPRFARPLPITFILDDSAQQQHDALIMVISSLQHLFLGMRPFWGNNESPLRFTVIDNNPVKFPTTFLSILRGRANRNATASNGYHSGGASQLQLTLDGPINLDGEILSVDSARGPVTISATEAFEFLKL